MRNKHVYWGVVVSLCLSVVVIGISYSLYPGCSTSNPCASQADCAKGMVCEGGYCKTSTSLQSKATPSVQVPGVVTLRDPSCLHDKCEPICRSECKKAGEQRCSSTTNAMQVCVLNAQGCLVWSAGVPCKAGHTCSYGKCSVPCLSYCQNVGDKRCALQGENILVCQKTAEGCLNWAKSESCAVNLVCREGQCVPPCKHQCDKLGDRRCSNDKKGVETCMWGYLGCRIWSGARGCPSGQSCRNDVCTPLCTNACPSYGATRCSPEGDSIQSCVDSDNGCWGWSPKVFCLAGNRCVNNQCTTQCINRCQKVGDTKCSDDGLSYVTCVEGADQCLTWSAARACHVGEYCAVGKCVPRCHHQCVLEGQTRCVAGGKHLQTCVRDSSGCMTWSVPTLCRANEWCIQGQCTIFEY